ncbi:MAG: DUF4345 domain-containing protein [Methylobacteriaceae bacterium]|nr:DUF4345 domain-containing protein [Methylobacteriaceae bacterium]
MNRGEAEDDARNTERLALQVAIGLAGLVPVLGGGYGALFGAASLVRLPTDPAADSHIHYLSGLLLAIGLAYWASIPDIEQRSARFSLLTFMVVLGGFARLLGLFTWGNPGAVMLGALAMELVVTPVGWLWQRRVARLFGAPLVPALGSAAARL